MAAFSFFLFPHRRACPAPSFSQLQVPLVTDPATSAQADRPKATIQTRPRPGSYSLVARPRRHLAAVATPVSFHPRFSDRRARSRTQDIFRPDSTADELRSYSQPSTESLR